MQITTVFVSNEFLVFMGEFLWPIDLCIQHIFMLVYFCSLDESYSYVRAFY